MPAHQYDGRQPENKNSQEMDRSIAQVETHSPDISHEPARPSTQPEKEKKQEHFHCYGY